MLRMLSTMVSPGGESASASADPPPAGMPAPASADPPPAGMPAPASADPLPAGMPAPASAGPLPAGTVPRASRHALVALALAVTLLLVLLTAGAQAAETPVTVKPAEVSTALFVAGDVARLSTVPAGTEDVVLEKALQQMYADEPGLAPATAEGYVGDMQALLAAPSAPSPASLQLMAGNQRILAIVAALERASAAELPAAARLAVSHLAAVALSGSSNIFADAEEPKYFEPLADARTNLSYTTFAPATALRATRTLASSDRQFGEARNALWARASEESVFSEWRELLTESNVLQSQALETLRTAIEAGEGTITAEPSHLTKLFTEGQTATQEESCEHGASEKAIGEKSISGIPTLQCSGGALYEAATAPSVCTSKCEEALKERQSRAAKREESIAAEHAEMVAAAELLRPSDNKAAELQVATAQAQAQITEEEVAWGSYEAQKAEREAIAKGVEEGLSAGSAVLALGTDNYSEGISGLIGVGFEIYEGVEGELSSPPPGPQEITLQDLADLSTQLAGFQQYTQEAFQAINTQVAQLSSQLARENYELKEQIGELGERLVKEQSTIYALQDEVQTLFAAQTKANLQGTIEDSVGWLRRTGEPLAATKFQEALVALKKYATEIANGALVNNAETKPYDFEGAFQQLTGKATTGEPAELSEDISYLARFPNEAGWPSSLAPSSLANTTFWAESSRAYAQLMLENAGHTTAADIAGVKALENEALKLEKTEGAWSETSDAGSKTGNEILNKAIAEFDEAAYGNGVSGVESVKTLLQEEAEEFFEKSLEKDVKTETPNPTGVKLWSGAEQPFSPQDVADAEYPALKWSECSGSEGGNGSQPMPAQFIEGLPKALINAVRLGIVGAPKTGEPLILEACRTITGAAEKEAHVVEKAAEVREDCPNNGKLKSCEIVGIAKTKSETNSEQVTETLTLTEGSTKYALASPKTCEQDALHWRGEGELYSEDPETPLTKDKGGIYKAGLGAPFTERHVGTVELTGVYFEEHEFDKPELGASYSPNEYEVFEGAQCPAEREEDRAGVEYATYGASENPLGSGSAIQQTTVVEKIDAKLRELQENAYDEGLKALQNPPHGNPAEDLGGARALVQSYVKLGLPQALDSDVALQSDVEGIGAQFLDPKPGSAGTPRPLPEQLNALVESWIGHLEASSGSQLTQLLGEDLIEEVKTRSEGWAKGVVAQVGPYVEGKAEGFDTGSEEKVGEQSALVESTLNRLQLTRDVLSEARAPSAETLTPSNDVGITEATVRGEVDPNGGVVESCVFEYGSTESYGHSVPCSAIPSASEKAVVVSATIANWTPEGSFHERVVLKTWGGTSYGEDVKVQLAQSAQAPAGLVIARTDTPGATIGGFTAEELPAGLELPNGAKQIVGALSFTVNVTPGGSARVKIELPAGSAPTTLYKPVRVAGEAKEYREVPSSLYTITGNVIELTLVDGGPDDEDGEVNGVIVDPLVPAVVTQQASAPAPTSTAPVSPPAPFVAPQAPTIGAPTATIGSPAENGVYAAGSVVKTKFDCAEAAGGPGIASCVDSGGASDGAGLLDTAKLGVYTYTVTATSRDGQSSSASIHYAVVARHECVSDRRVTLHVAYHVNLPPGTSLRSSKVLQHGRVMAKLHGPTEVAVLRFGSHHKGPYEVTLVAKLSNGETRRTTVVFHTCVGVPKPAARKR